MNLRNQLRWGGLWIIFASLLMNVTNIMMYLEHPNTAIQAVYGIGFTGLILACTIIHIAQARQAGVIGLLAYLVSVVSLVISNVVTFLTLADLAGIEGANKTLEGIWDPYLHAMAYGVFVGLILLSISVARAGVFPKAAGVLMLFGVALQLSAQYALDWISPLFFFFTIGGSILFAASLIWIGWTLWSGKGWNVDNVQLSNLDRTWGAPFIMFSAILLIVNAYINSIADLTLLDGTTHLVSTFATILVISLLYTAQADRAGGLGLAGFFLTHLGSTLTVITAYLIFGQLAGQIADNRALMASWVDIPVGRYGSYMVMLGSFLFGLSVIRAEVFPRWSGWLFVIGIALLLPSQFQTQDYLFSVFWVIGAALEGIGMGWMGWALVKVKPTPD